ncbi:Hypothetical predicted protein [Podarcis lilfordi]|uniref:Uncharacterized protein n=1 Tax=Podarcis lilfordi TaxID=74358 RepID=A0AA35JU32_9SAUR|nr:Hypothetical predicted protein [Podarcis lilfordi]
MRPVITAKRRGKRTRERRREGAREKKKERKEGCGGVSCKKASERRERKKNPEGGSGDRLAIAALQTPVKTKRVSPCELWRSPGKRGARVFRNERLNEVREPSGAPASTHSGIQKEGSLVATYTNRGRGLHAHIPGCKMKSRLPGKSSAPLDTVGGYSSQPNKYAAAWALPPPPVSRNVLKQGWIRASSACRNRSENRSQSGSNVNQTSSTKRGRGDLETRGFNHRENQPRAQHQRSLRLLRLLRH